MIIWIDFTAFLCYNNPKKGGGDMSKKFPYPKRYWGYLGIALVGGISLLVSIFCFANLTDDRELWEFTSKDWRLFAVFSGFGLVCIGVAFCFSVLAGKINIKLEKEKDFRREQSLFLSINKDDYDYIWHDFSKTARALISRKDGKFVLCVQKYNALTEVWQSVADEALYDDLKSLKKDLFYEFDFYCDENAELDEHGDGIYKET